MTRKELLQEQYEDALFALLMDDIVTDEGEQALAEKEDLKNNLSTLIPDDLHQKCRRTIDRSFSNKRMKNTAHIFSKVVVRAAVIALIGMLLFTTAFAASPSFRAKALNFVIEVFDEGTAFRAADVQKSIKDIDVKTNWLPDGCSLADEYQNDTTIWKQYQTQSGEKYEVNIRKLAEGDAVAFDTEDAIVENITIQNRSAMKVEKNNCVQVIWTQEDLGMVIEVYGENTEADTTIYFAENILITNR